MLVLPAELVKEHLTEAELTELHEFLNEMDFKPKKLHRDFSDVQPVAKLLAKAFPQLVPVQAYPGCFNTTQKIQNWSNFERNVLQRFGVRLTKLEIELIANCTPGAVDTLLYTIMSIMKEHQTAKKAKIAEEAKQAFLEEKLKNVRSTRQKHEIDKGLPIYSVSVNGEPQDKTKRMVSYAEYLEVLKEFKRREWEVMAAQKTIKKLKAKLVEVKNRTERMEKKFHGRF